MSTRFRLGRITLPAMDEYLVAALVDCGDYSLGEMWVYERLIGRGATVLDVGANIGVMSILFGRLVGPSGRVVAFEPCPFTYGLLVENAALNGLTNVDARRHIAAATTGDDSYIDILPERLDGPLNFGALSIRNDDPGRHGRMVPTPRIALDDLALERCDFIKIDVEGHETAVILGARRTLSHYRPIVSLETGDAGHDLGWFDVLKEMGYRAFACRFRIVTEPNFKNQPIDAYPPHITAQAVCLPPGIAVDPVVARTPFVPLPDRDALMAFCRSLRRAPD